MKIILDNAQHTPHLDFIDYTGKITAQISICKNGLLATGNIPTIPYCFPKTDGIILYDSKGFMEIHKDWLIPPQSGEGK